MKVKLKNIKRKFIPIIKKTLGKKGFGMDIKLAKEHPKTKDIDLYNKNQEYLTTINSNVLGYTCKEITEQIDGMGRPKIKAFQIKRNKLKFTMSPQGDPQWYFLPFLTAGQMKKFLEDIDVQNDITEIISKLVRGELVTVLVPENREPHLKEILKNGAGSNPYKKVVKVAEESRHSLREALGYDI